MAEPNSGEESEILKITVGEPTMLSSVTKQDCSSVAASRTGVVAAFYPPRPSAGPEVYRISEDGGVTWGEELPSPPLLGGGACSGALREGGVIKVLDRGTPIEGEQGWFTEVFARFTDDMARYETETVRVFIEDADFSGRKRQFASWWPVFDKGKIVQLPDGDLLSPMYGLFKEDPWARVVISRSTDQGRTWRYHATVMSGPEKLCGDLPGQFGGYTEPGLALLANGQLLCMLRTQGAALPLDYKPLCVSWSDDLGRTWTKPVPTEPHLLNIWPTVEVLDNGVVACVYGRPGFHVVFSTDNGHTWRDRISFSHRGEPIITGQVDMVKAGPNRLVAIGATEDGTKVFPITVERAKVSPARVALAGSVLDERGNPIAGAAVERSPNRYTGGYRSIREEDGRPVVRTDAEGRFRFDAVKLGEMILTVEAERYAPQYRHVKVTPQARSQEFRLKVGHAICGRVVDDQGLPIGGVDVSVNRWGGCSWRFGVVYWDDPDLDARAFIADENGDLIEGARLVIDRWRGVTDPEGFFHIAVEEALPDEVMLRVYQIYRSKYEPFEAYLPFEEKVSLSQIGQEPIVLKKVSGDPSIPIVRV